MGNALAHIAEAELVLGRYRPLRPLGSGGSGSVWLAADERNGLEVALKIVALDGKAGARAEREAEASARLRHPGCLRAYAYGHERGHVYIAYEYAPGPTFREALRSGKLDDATAVEACAQLAEALEHAHSRGVLHRDVKPANVLLVEGGDVSVRLLDFGLAAFAEAETLTAQGDVPGTLAYIAPERLAGDESTAAADVWAVGVMAWEALAGRHPFVRASLMETGKAIERGAPSLGEVRPDLPDALVNAVDRALSLDPRKRPSAARLADALRTARPRARRVAAGNRLVPGRLGWGGVAGLYAGGVAVLLPFWPAGFAFAFAAVAVALAFAHARLGLAFALAVAVFPLGNLSVGLAIAYGVVAVAWLAFCKRPELLAATAVVLGYGLARPPDAALAGIEDPLLAARELAFSVPPESWWLAFAAGLATATLALAQTPWRIALWGAALLALLVLPNPNLPAWPLVAFVWAACAILAVRTET